MNPSPPTTLRDDPADHPDDPPKAPSQANARAASDRSDDFVRLLTANHRQLYVYLLSLTCNRQLVDDLLQETHLVMWREFATFVPGTNFGAWSRRIAYNQLLAWRKKQHRVRVQFSDDFLQLVAEELDTADEYLEQRLQALRECLTRLPNHHRELIHHRYSTGDAIETIAHLLGRKPDAVYRMLSRIRRTLHDCVSRSLA
jgi:RNA polymerase sigma-70 factor (ECF subfamily)